MNIAEAARQAMEKGRCIARPFGEGTARMKVKPTDTADRCLIFDFYDQPYKRWSPKAADLIAEDWEVVEE